jgi:valyl-tRNA synthetase
MKKEEGLTKEDITREQFLERAWAWTEKYGGEIQNQQRKLGCSCDWERRRFTLDEGLSDAVLEEFVKLYNEGLIYKGKRMINWCTNCHTSLSDAEVEYEEEASHLWHIRYKVKDTDEYIEVATTRPETMLGDTAVAVHPDDERYTNLVGKTCILPIMNKEIPIIADSFVEKEFGSGAVKITPAHDLNDYQAGLRHNLDIIEVFDESSIMNDLVPEYKGMKSIEARKLIVEKLKEIGALVEIEDYTHNVGKCYRCHNVIEPRISEQWFVAMKKLAEPAIKAVKESDIKFIPKRYEKTYFNWMENIQDWCISRQLWWGHRIPAYYCEECEHINVAKERPIKCEKCGSIKMHQDEDTLDTWFSSALWPFSTLGWPNKESEDFKTFYPTNVLVTGYDIIFFWIARMIFSGLFATGKRPFSDILIHGIVRDSKGRKMSKSLGNGIDPIEIIDKYGADSLRFSVLSGTTMGNDIRYMPEKLEQASNFANKIWNAAKFVKMNMAEDSKIIEFSKDNVKSNFEELKLEDKWIINKLEKLIKEVTENIENYDLGIALDKIYSFIWNDFCNWYIEFSKIRLNNEENLKEKVQVSYVLDYVFRNSLKLLHPFMPFVTSKIYEELVKYDDSELMVSSWPEVKNEFEYDEEEKIMEKLQTTITDVRNIRNEKHIHPTKKSELIFVTSKYKTQIKEAESILLKFAYGDSIVIKENKENIEQNAINIITDGIELFIPISDLVDMEEERKRLEQEKERLENEVARCNKMLSNPGFVNKAPEIKINEERSKLEKYNEQLKLVIERLK